MLAIVLSTDIVGSTERQASLGDRGWTTLVKQHHEAIREVLTRFRGLEQDTAGDGFYIRFDGPARAIQCAQEILRLVRALEIEVRAGVHTGECDIVEGKCSGLSVSIGARVMDHARPVRGPRVANGQGPHRRERPRLRRCWGARAEGRPELLALVSCGDLIVWGPAYCGAGSTIWKVSPPPRATLLMSSRSTTPSPTGPMQHRTMERSGQNSTLEHFAELSYAPVAAKDTHRTPGC